MRRIIDKNRGNEYCRFSVWFLFCVVVILLPLGLLRRSLIQEGDSFNQSFPLFVYIGQWLRACLHGEIKFFDFRLGLGDDVLHALNWHGFGDITQIFSIVVPYEYSEYAYNMIMIFKLWLCGIAFLIYSRRYIVHMEYRIAGALVYACNSYTLAWGFNCWMFLMPVMTFPLILAGIDVICSKEDNFSGLLLVGIWIQSLNGFYFLYMEVLLSALYFVIKEIIILQDIVTGRFKRLIQDGLSVLGQAMVAVSIGAPLLLPSFAGYLQSSRTGSTKAYGIWEMLIYPFNHYCTVLAHLLIPNIYRNILTLGYPVIFGIVISFFHSSRQNKLHRYLLILFSVLYCIPLWGSITNGFSYSTDRWIFGLILIAAILMAIGSDMEVASSGKEKLLFCLLSCISVILYLVDEDWYSGKIFSAIFYGIIGIIILFLWDKRKKDSKIVLLCCIVLLSINGILVFLPRKAGGSGYVYGFKGKESTRQEVDQRIDMLEPIGDKFERKDVYSTSLGASLIKDFYGTTEYFSTLNGNSSEFYRELYISPGVYGATWVLKGLDGRMELEALLSVGEIMDYTGDGFEIVYRHNDMYLPLGIAYQSWISREQFDQMNPMEKEASLIQYIVLEEQEEDIVKLVPKADEVDGSISGSNQEVTFSAVMVNVIEEGNIIHAKEDAAIRLYLNDVNVCDQKFPVETELYVKLQDMKLHDEGTADLRVGNKKIQLRNEDNDYYMGIDEFWINVTEWSSDQKGQYFEIKLPSAKSYSLGEIKVYQHNVNYNAIEERQENGLEEVQISSNQIYGRADYAEPSIVMFSIPYSKGWKAYVDGQEKPIYKADIGFIAIELEEGTHTILLKYMSPGFIPGCLCAMGGILSLAIILCKRKKKGKEQNVNSAA